MYTNQFILVCSEILWFYFTYMKLLLKFLKEIEKHILLFTTGEWILNIINLVFLKVANKI